MEPNESSSYNNNREYFQILEKQRKDVLREILWKCDHGPYKGPCKMKAAPRTPEEPQNGDPIEINPEFDPKGPRHLRVLQEVPGQVVKRLQTTEINGPIPARRNEKDLREIQKTVQDYGHRLSNVPMKVDSLCHKMDEILKILPDLHKNLTDLKTEVADLRRNQRDKPESSISRQVIFDITKNENFFPCDDLYHLQQPVIGRYEGMLEIAGHEFLVAGVAGRENGCMTLGLSFLEDHKPWGRKGIREAKIMIGGAFGTPWFRVKTPPIYFHDTGADILLGSLRRKAFNRIMPINFRSKRGDFDAKLTNPKMHDKRKFGKALLSFRQQGLIDSDSFYKESEEEIKNLREALVELKTMDISEESILSLENVKRLIQRNFSENPLAWWDRNKIEATLKIKEECKYEYVRYKPIQMNMEDKKDMQIIIKDHISLGLIEPGISAHSSPGFLIKMESESKKFTAFSTPQVNKIEFLGILIDEAGIELQEHIVEKIRNFPDKGFRPLLKETESAKWKWEEIHTQRVRELKQVCNNLPKLAIPQDEDELVVYTDVNDYRWAAVLMKKTTIGEEPCRYTGGLFTEQQAQVWHINENEFFAVWKAFKK
ncbi:Enzymatic polyprotein [Sesamum angolense]|uniref:Enzymatic polyprotein n=1 Tax=Sesamum angolense TaxID=2727404 RepID=A0AAE2BJP4_9LAMI|nr:Enzymatic polyprotein [Sesamum angolense]